MIRAEYPTYVHSFKAMGLPETATCVNDGRVDRHFTHSHNTVCYTMWICKWSNNIVSSFMEAQRGPSSGVRAKQRE
jgi:hypothetical protein